MDRDREESDADFAKTGDSAGYWRLKSVQGYEIRSYVFGASWLYSGWASKNFCAMKSVPQGFPQCAQNSPLLVRFEFVTMPSVVPPG